MKREVLRLTRDVKNPRPDKRYARQFDAMAVWPAGALLTVTMWENSPLPEIGMARKYGQMALWPDGHPLDKNGAKDLLEACEPAPPSVMRSLLAQDGTQWPTEVILKALVKRGSLKLEDLDAALEDIANGEDEEEVDR